jgi:hypothetical protein
VSLSTGVRVESKSEKLGQKSGIKMEGNSI